MNTLDLQRELLEHFDEHLDYNLNSSGGRIRFLAHLAGIPVTSILNDDKRLAEYIINWINND